MSKVLAVNISEKKGVIKHSIDKGYFIVDHGLEGDIHGGKGHRQVSLLGTESINKMKRLGLEGFCTSKFVPNLTTEQILLQELPAGTKIKIGDVLMEVTQIGKECYIDCDIRHEVGNCIMPRECIFARVLRSGWIKPGDEILWEAEEEI